MSPMTVPAMTGPTPKTWVRVVPETLTAQASFLRVPRSWVSRWRMSSRNSAASSARARSTAPDGDACSKILAARAAEISFGWPPGTRLQSTACSRQATWLRSRARSRCRLDHTFSTAGWSSAITGRAVLDRSAATATDSASSGSFLFVSPACSSRTRTPASAERPGPARRRRRAAGPAAGPARRHPPPPRSAPARPLPTPPASQPDRPMRGPAARPAAPPPGRSPLPCAWPLCGSTPIITAVIDTLQVVRREWRTWRACLIPDLLALAPLLSHATARPGRLAPRYKARPGQY